MIAKGEAVMHGRRWGQLRSLMASQRGQGLAEYTLIIGFIVMVTIATVTLFGTAIASKIGEMAGAF